MMAKYVDGIDLPEEMTVREVMRALEVVGEVGEGHWNQGQPRISFEVPLEEGQDIWGLRDTLEELRTRLQAISVWSLDFEPKQENILWESSIVEEFKKKGRDEVLERVIPGLRDLALKGYQPQYNGRPSCPFCLSFVDEDEEHSHDCSLVRFLDMCENDGLDDPLNASIRLELDW